MALFEINERVRSKSKDLENIKKVKKSSNIISFMADLEQRVAHLDYPHLILFKKEDVKNYLLNSKEDDWIVGIDTETTGLNPLSDKLVGMSLFVKNQLPVYVPINHIDYITLERVDNQITQEELKELFLELPQLKYLLHKSTFDIRFIENNVGVRIKPFWDTLVAGKMLNENEDEHSLKALHTKYISREKNSKFNELFKDLTFDRVPIKLGAPYAAYDAQMTYELFDFQRKHLNPNNEKGDLDKVYEAFRTIEMPTLEVIVDMEQRGVSADYAVMDKLKAKYERLEKEALDYCNSILEKYVPDMEKYNANRPVLENGKLGPALDIPINLSSPTQLAIFIYDILQEPPFSKQEPRSTGIDAIQKLNSDFGKALLDYRKVEKMLSTFVTPMYEYSKYDGKIHGRYNSLGAKTGRFSSNEPNLQNIPARGDKVELRTIFSGGTDYKEYPEQEVYVFEKAEEVQLENKEWVFVELLKVGDKLVDGEVVKEIIVEEGWLGKVRVSFNI